MFFFPIFLLFVVVNLVKKFKIEEDNNTPLHYVAEQNVILNYYPFLFHSLIVVLLLLSVLTSTVLTSNGIHILVSDGIFQFFLSILVFIISILNPFTPISEKTKTVLTYAMQKEPNPIMRWLITNKNWQLLELGLCIIVIWVFIQQKLLVLPPLNSGMLSNVFLVLIAFFIITSIVQLINAPKIFKRNTLFRLSLLLKTFRVSFFISVGLILFITLSSVIFKLNLDEKINYEGIVLLVFNVVMAYNEYKILNPAN
ncbi:hypothetical protein [Pedobacter jejuensis]|uniref:Uncharacterized protein n=1 Tax=Pedobacter jejuensis TaxID=1268550 RepID=A0A3N0BTD6_9SPHI|nr:hypothetical protein [Pedobacter jejuensis]RNL52343.1 hypothetical protein D7004_12320 [Pedobacter jejuensis]